MGYSLQQLAHGTNGLYRDDAMLKQYDIKANDAILAEDKHMGLYEDLLQNRDAKLIAGGAAQNTARGAQVRCIFFYTCVTDMSNITVSLVHPPRKLGRLHWLRRQRQVRRFPDRRLQKGRCAYRIPHRRCPAHWQVWCCHHRPQP